MIHLQKVVSDFNIKHHVKMKRSTRILDLTSEVGEVCKLTFSEDVGNYICNNKWEEELGDVLYSLLSLMNDLDIHCETALNNVLEKYKNRLEKQNSMSSNL